MMIFKSIGHEMKPLGPLTHQMKPLGPLIFFKSIGSTYLSEFAHGIYGEFEQQLQGWLQGDEAQVPHGVRPGPAQLLGLNEAL